MQALGPSPGNKTGRMASFLLDFRNNLKAYHWQTKSYARHKTTDELIQKLDALIDSFIEVAASRYGRPDMPEGCEGLGNWIDNEGPRNFLRGLVTWLQADCGGELAAGDLDLKTIRDQMMQDISQALYLFTFQ